MLSKTKLATLLGRPLTSTEDSNYKTYLDIATQRLSSLLCLSLSDDSGARIYPSRAGYRTLYIDPFTAITSVKLDGSVVATYVKKQGDSYQGDWFDALEFDDPLYGEKIEVTATWGFDDCMPSDLAQLLAGLFAIHELEPGNVKSKKIEDFSVTYKDGSEVDSLIAAHLGTVQKYAQCARAIEHGSVQPRYYF